MPSMRVPRMGAKPKKAPIGRKLGVRGRTGRGALLPDMGKPPHNNGLRP